MNYCQFRNDVIKRMCNSIKPLLPPEYQQVEYIQGTGNQAIDTGIDVTATLMTSVEFEIVTGFNFSSSSFLLGAFYQNGGDVTAYTVALLSSSQLRLGAQSSGGVTITNYTCPTISAGTRYALSYRSSVTTVNDSIINTGSLYYTGNPPYSVWVGGRNDYYSGAAHVNYTPYLRLYRAQLGTVNNAAEYRDLIPCYRKSDSVTGMYDLINSEFIPYTGTANFIAGNDV